MSQENSGKKSIPISSLLSGFTPSNPHEQVQNSNGDGSAAAEAAVSRQHNPVTKVYDPVKDQLVTRLPPDPRKGRMSLSSMMNQDDDHESSSKRINVSKLIISNDFLHPPPIADSGITKTTAVNSKSNANEKQQKKSSSNNTTSGTDQEKKKVNRKKPAVHHPNPTIMLPSFDDTTGKKQSKQNPSKFGPIIALHIPLVPPGSAPTQSQVIFNVMKVCEDKYGFNVMHPNGRIAFDLDDLEDDVDDDVNGLGDGSGAGTGAVDRSSTGNGDNDGNGGDDDDDDDDEEESESIGKKLNLKFRPGMSDEDKEEMVLREIHRRKMENNKRIGKYDVHDPFIDDEELLFEEQTKTNKDGFFVYYGQLVDETITNSKRRAPGSSSTSDANGSSGNPPTKRKRPGPKPGWNSNASSGSPQVQSSRSKPKSDKRKQVETATKANAPKLIVSSELLPQELAPAPAPAPAPISISASNTTSTSKQKQTAEKKTKAAVKPQSGSEKASAPAVPVIASTSTNNNKIIIGGFPPL